ncbi:integral membrane protein MviN [alpha proteobacterium HIMB59]|nr:integral membrane protein MviN [alpha proteobacterium HIMB59]
MKLNNFSKISSNIFSSRVTGFFRDVLFANFLGANILSDAFLFAFRLPNLFRRILAEGAMNSVFIPLYIRQSKESQSLASDFTSAVFLIFLSITSIMTIFVFLFSEQITSFLAPGFIDNEDQFNFAIQLIPIIFPFLIFVTLSAVISSVLNIKGKFFLPSFLSVILNVLMIGTLLIFKSESHFPLAWSILIAGIIQLFLLMINANFFKSLFQFGLKKLSLLGSILRTFFKRFLFSVLGSGIVQLNIFVSMLFASLVGEGAISHIYYADRIIDLPFALIAVAMTFTLLPYLSKNILDEEKNANAFNQTIIFCFIFALPSSFALFFISEDIVRVLFGRGEFLNKDILITSNLLLIYSFSLPGYMISRICNQVFYSYERVDLPIKASIPTFILNLVLCFSLYRPLGVYGLAIAGAISVWINVFIQIFYLKIYFSNFYKKIKFLNIIKIAKILTSSSIMIFVILFLQNILNLNIYIDLIILIVIGVFVFFAVLNLLKLEEYRLIYKSALFN